MKRKNSFLPPKCRVSSHFLRRSSAKALKSSAKLSILTKLHFNSGALAPPMKKNQFSRRSSAGSLAIRGPVRTPEQLIFRPCGCFEPRAFCSQNTRPQRVQTQSSDSRTNFRWHLMKGKIDSGNTLSFQIFFVVLLLCTLFVEIALHTLNALRETSEQRTFIRCIVIM